MKFALLILAAATLYEQSVARLLGERFSEPHISHLFVKASTGEILGERWPDASRPVAPGSLVKVFTALAYAKRTETGFRSWRAAKTRGAGCRAGTEKSGSWKPWRTLAMLTSASWRKA